MCLRPLLIVAAFLLSVNSALAVPALVAEEIELRWGPSEEFPAQAVIPGGTQVDVESCATEWCLVRVGDLEGFLPLHFLNFLSPQPALVVPSYPAYEFADDGYVYGPGFAFPRYGWIHDAARQDPCFIRAASRGCATIPGAIRASAIIRVRVLPGRGAVKRSRRTGSRTISRIFSKEAGSRTISSAIGSRTINRTSSRGVCSRTISRISSKEIGSSTTKQQHWQQNNRREAGSRTTSRIFNREISSRTISSATGSRTISNATGNTITSSAIGNRTILRGVTSSRTIRHGATSRTGRTTVQVPARVRNEDTTSGAKVTKGGSGNRFCLPGTCFPKIYFPKTRAKIASTCAR